MCDYCSWIDQILAKVKAEVKKEEKSPTRVDPVIVVHGGAGRIPQKEREYMLNEVKSAAITAYNDLIKGRTSVDAVERAISYMESNPCFNCAKGGSLDVNEEVVMDAAIVSSYGAGCVGAVRDVEHPIALARKVMENTEHVLIVEGGAQKFALEVGIPTLPRGNLNAKHDSSFFHAERASVDPLATVFNDACNASEKVGKGECVPEERSYTVQSTDPEETTEAIISQASGVGAVAFDRKKRLASGTSTAGEKRKPIGAVSAIGTIIGCGVYADENGCASVSGEDKSIYCYAPARKIVRRLLDSTSVDLTVNEELEKFEQETGQSCIGAIALSAKGETSVSFKCAHFPWALCTKGYVYYGCAKKECFSEEIKNLERPLDCMCGTLD